ncbi:MAG: hypothetical protein ACI8UO_005509 [Verrucomicrobiales bacterium]|jgi:hypothetical protein
MKNFLLISLLVLPLSLAARVFTDEDGRKVDAEIVGVRDGHVVLTKNGKTGRWPIEKLSTVDQVYVRAWSKDPTTSPKLRVRLFERDGAGPSGVFQGPTSKAPTSIPLIQQTEAKANHKHYVADITNDAQAQVDALQLTVAYVLFVVNTQNKIVLETGFKKIAEIPVGERTTVTTEGITFLRTKTTSMTLGTNPLGHLNIGSDTSRAKGRFAGAWVRIYSAESELLAEAKELIPELERLDPMWTGSTGVIDFPLMEAIDGFEKLLESLPKLPEFPDLEDLPKPPGAPPKPPGLPPKPPRPPFGPKKK